MSKLKIVASLPANCNLPCRFRRLPESGRTPDRVRREHPVADGMDSLKARSDSSLRLTDPCSRPREPCPAQALAARGADTGSNTVRVFLRPFGARKSTHIPTPGLRPGLRSHAAPRPGAAGAAHPHRPPPQLKRKLVDYGSFSSYDP